jgi:hypothetical protein
MLTSGVVLLHDNLHPHTTSCIQAPLDHFNWVLFGHPSYSPDHAPSDYHLFTHTYLKNWLRSQCFNNNEELMEGVKIWRSSQAIDFFDRGIQKRILRYDKCLNSHSDYVEK